MRRAAIAIFSVFLGGCAFFGFGPSNSAPPAPPAPQVAWMVDWEGRPIGQATLTEARGGVLIHLEFSEHTLPPGWHGLHIHQNGRCADFARGFQDSGAHMTRGSQHGLLNPGGPEAGDLPNLFVPTAGAYGAEFFATGVTLFVNPIDTRVSLMGGNGAALVIHAGPDDHMAQPIGGAGARIACAAFTATP